MKKILFLVLFLPLFFSLSFGAWQHVAGGAILTSATFLLVVFIIGYGIESDHLKLIAKDEFVQLIILAILMLVLFGADGILNVISQSSALTMGQPSIQDAAILSLDITYQNLSDYLDVISKTDNNIAIEASKSYSCQLTGGGYTISGCGGFAMLSTPFSLSGSIIGYSIAEVTAAKTLIEVSKEYALVLILPIGILLRTFRFSRGAGGFLIALGISAYILLPTGIIFVDMLDKQFANSPASSEYLNGEPEVLSFNYSSGCDPAKVWGLGKSNEERAVKAYTTLRKELKKYLYIALLKATLGPVLALLFFVGGLKALNTLFGVEIDVSAIARFV